MEDDDDIIALTSDDYEMNPTIRLAYLEKQLAYLEQRMTKLSAHSNFGYIQEFGSIVVGNGRSALRWLP
jgi:hypothetical protein